MRHVPSTEPRPTYQRVEQSHSSSSGTSSVSSNRGRPRKKAETTPQVGALASQKKPKEKNEMRKSDTIPRMRARTPPRQIPFEMTAFVDPETCERSHSMPQSTSKPAQSEPKLQYSEFKEGVLAGTCLHDTNELIKLCTNISQVIYISNIAMFIYENVVLDLYL